MSDHETESPPTRHVSDERALGAFRKVPRTGVIYVMGEAARHGYRPGGRAERRRGATSVRASPRRAPCPDRRRAARR